MKINRLNLALSMLVILALIGNSSCKKMTENQSPATNSTTKQSPVSGTKGKGGNPVSEMFPIHSSSGTNGGGHDPYPIDCIVLALLDNYSIVTSCSGTPVINFNRIETDWASPSPTLSVTINGFPFTATYTGAEPANHCLSYYKLLNISIFDIGLIDICTPQNLNMVYYDAATGLSSSETITVAVTGCSNGSYQCYATSPGPGQLSLSLPWNICGCQSAWPPHYTFRYTSQSGNVQTLTRNYPDYFTPITVTVTGNQTYTIEGRNECQGVTGPFVPGIPPTVFVQ